MRTSYHKEQSAAHLIHSLLNDDRYSDMDDIEPLIKKALEMNDIIIKEWDKFIDRINSMNTKINHIINIIHEAEKR